MPATATTAPSSCVNSSPLTSSFNVCRVPLGDITPPDRTNGRINLDQDSLADLARSIATIGQLHPITLRPTPNGYHLVAGHRRYLAIQSLGRPTIDALVLELDDSGADAVRLAENALRQQLTPIEEAYQLAPLVEANPRGADGVAVSLNRSLTWILDRLDLLNMPDALQHAIHDKQISIAAAKRLARITPPDLRDLRIRDAVLHGINAQTAALWLSDSQRGGSQEAGSTPEAPPGRPPTYVTATLALCFVCHEHKDLTATQPVRLCDDCHRNIAQSLSNDIEAPTT